MPAAEFAAAWNTAAGLEAGVERIRVVVGKVPRREVLARAARRNEGWS